MGFKQGWRLRSLFGQPFGPPGSQNYLLVTFCYRGARMARVGLVLRGLCWACAWMKAPQQQGAGGDFLTVLCHRCKSA